MVFMCKLPLENDVLPHLLNPSSFLPFACVENGQSHHLAAGVADDDVIVSQLTVSGMARLFVVHVQNVGRGIVRHPNQPLRRLFHVGQQLQVIIDFSYATVAAFRAKQFFWSERPLSQTRHPAAPVDAYKPFSARPLPDGKQFTCFARIDSPGLGNGFKNLQAHASQF
jgi:hypothetical protein